MVNEHAFLTYDDAWTLQDYVDPAIPLRSNHQRERRLVKLGLLALVRHDHTGHYYQVTTDGLAIISNLPPIMKRHFTHE